MLGSAASKLSTKSTGAVVAYCGRVPVRVMGPISSGDVLVPSGNSDGIAQVRITTPTW